MREILFRGKRVDDGERIEGVKDEIKRNRQSLKNIKESYKNDEQFYKNKIINNFKKLSECKKG